MSTTVADEPRGWRSALPAGVRPYTEAAPLAALFLGISSGFPYAMIGATLTTRLKQDGIPIVGFTWYSLTDQVDWDTALREDAGRVNPLGLYDLDRKIRPVGELYRALIRQWQPLLSTDSIVLTLGY